MSEGSHLKTTNDRYFTYQGKPVYVLGSGMEGVGREQAYDLAGWKKYIELLAAHQFGKAKFRIRFFPWGFCWNQTAIRAVECPWEIREAARHTYNLHNFSTEYWAMVKRIAAYAERKGVLLEYVLFDACSISEYCKVWVNHPWNANHGNGGMIVNGVTGIDDFYAFHDCGDFNLFAQEWKDDWTWQKKNQYHQQRYVKKAVDELAGRRNVHWDICNEISGRNYPKVPPDKPVADYLKHWIGFLQRHDPNHNLIGSSTYWAANQEIGSYWGMDMILPHLEAHRHDANDFVHDSTKALWDIGKPVIFDEYVGGYDQDTDHTTWMVERWDFWHAFVSEGHMTGRCWGRFKERPFHNWMLHFCRFIEGTDFVSMRSHDELVLGLPSGLFQHTLASPGREYIIYFTTPVDRPRFGGGFVQMELESGLFTLRFYNPRKGEYYGRISLEQPEKGKRKIKVPAFAEDCVLHMVATKGHDRWRINDAM